jgi:hypothetical protein
MARFRSVLGLKPQAESYCPFLLRHPELRRTGRGGNQIFHGAQQGNTYGLKSWAMLNCRFAPSPIGQRDNPPGVAKILSRTRTSYPRFPRPLTSLPFTNHVSAPPFDPLNACLYRACRDAQGKPLTPTVASRLASPQVHDLPRRNRGWLGVRRFRM